MRLHIKQLRNKQTEPSAFSGWLGLVRAPQIAALVLMTLFGSPWVALAASSVVSPLPACCRAHGRHGCAAHTAPSGHEQGFQATTPKCCFFPVMSSPGHGLDMAGVAARQIYFSELASHPAIHAQADAQLRISFDRSRQKRGPPSLDLC